jgi:hypothetical protein
MLYADRSLKNNKITFVINREYESGGRLKLKFIFFYGGNSLTTALIQMKSCTVKDGHIPKSFI